MGQFVIHHRLSLSTHIYWTQVHAGPWIFDSKPPVLVGFSHFEEHSKLKMHKNHAIFFFWMVTFRFGVHSFSSKKKRQTPTLKTWDPPKMTQDCASTNVVLRSHWEYRSRQGPRIRGFGGGWRGVDVFFSDSADWSRRGFWQYTFWKTYSNRRKIPIFNMKYSTSENGSFYLAMFARVHVYIYIHTH